MLGSRAGLRSQKSEPVPRLALTDPDGDEIGNAYTADQDAGIRTVSITWITPFD